MTVTPDPLHIAEAEELLDRDGDDSLVERIAQALAVRDEGRLSPHAKIKIRVTHEDGWVKITSTDGDKYNAVVTLHPVDAPKLAVGIMNAAEWAMRQ